MKVKEAIENLQHYDPEAEFGIILFDMYVNIDREAFVFSGTTPEEADSVAIYANDYGKSAMLGERENGNNKKSTD